MEEHILEEHIFNINKLKELCTYWQKRLRLQHWDISLSIARQKDLDSDNSQGQCTWVQNSALATIKILDHIDWPDTPFKQDMEITLVHELLHLHFCPFDNTAKGSLEDIMLERAIEHISRALVETKREVRQCR